MKWDAFDDIRTPAAWLDQARELTETPRRRRTWSPRAKGALIAACLCVAVVGTTVATQSIWNTPIQLEIAGLDLESVTPEFPTPIQASEYSDYIQNKMEVQAPNAVPSEDPAENWAECNERFGGMLLDTSYPMEQYTTSVRTDENGDLWYASVMSEIGTSDDSVINLDAQVYGESGAGIEWEFRMFPGDYNISTDTYVTANGFETTILVGSKEERPIEDSEDISPATATVYAFFTYDHVFYTIHADQYGQTDTTKLLTIVKEVLDSFQ